MISRPTLNGRHFDVLVIGGGINGVAIARECASAGRSTLLVERHDFAAGTTSRSTRLIHGGLRYLEHGDLAQVRESLRERGKLLQQYPNLVRPLHFLLALDETSRRSALAVRAGLWLYRRLAGRGYTVNAREEQHRLERVLDSGRRFSVFNFEDAQCEFPERLVAEWLVQAGLAGCVARNHTSVLAVKRVNGSAKGALLRDELNGLEETIEAGSIVNATGPWADQICEDSGIRAGQPPMIGGVRGSHIVLPKFTGAPEAAVYTEAVDGRPVFVIPWNDQILVGTTEVPDHHDPARVQPSDSEIQYLLASLHHLFPRAGISPADVRYSFAGVRPLPYSPNARSLAVTRRHFFHDHASDGATGMTSLIGGKLTTAGCVAREYAERIGIRPLHVPVAAVPSASGLRELSERTISDIASVAEISRESASVIFEWHGPRSAGIAEGARKDPALRARLCPHTDHIVAEAVDAFENQCAITLGDVLLRRVPIALGACWSNECGRIAAARIGAAVNWDDRRIGAELEAFEAECDAFLHSRTSNLPAHVDADRLP